jgi:hypothetical protein
MKRITLLFSCFLLSYWSQAQHGYIVKFTDNTAVLNLKNQLQDIFIQELSADFNIYLLDFEESKLLNYLQTSPKVIFFNKNHIVSASSERCLIRPNDSLLNQQWGHFKTNIDDVWCKTLGGISTGGDTIVIGVLEVKGYDFRHKDLFGNIWKNKFEIPNNKLDDDNNGIIDDYLGINCNLKNDNITSHYHGTQVLGILGAIGDNVSGIAGTNPNIKLAMASNAELESEWIIGLNYFFQLRKKYNDSNGKSGAFIPVINISGGFDKLKASDMPILCNFFNELGKVGVLTINAVTNSELNIDTEGDMPADCPTDFLITVTNSEKNDKKYQQCGWGAKNVDLAAPGTDILTTTLNNKYTEIIGTSAACPYVSGAIALLYSLPIRDFIADVKSSPSTSALKMKKFILNGVQILPNLSLVTKTSGRLDVLQSMKLMEEEYPAIDNLTLLKSYPNPAQGILNINFSTNLYQEHQLVIFDVYGKLVAQKTLIPDNLIDLQTQIDVANFPMGIYILKLSNNKDSVVNKFMVKH